MANSDEDKIFDAKAIRDTNTHNSSDSSSGEFTAKTILIENGLDQGVTLQLQGTRDSSVYINCGSSFVATASTNCYRTVSDYFPEYRITATCSTSPTTGTLDVHILKAKS